MSKQEQGFDAQRWIVAVIGVLALLFAAFQYSRLGFDEATKQPATGICVKLGLVFIAMSLAWPGLRSLFKKMPPSFGYSMLAALLLMIVRPKAAIWALAILVVTALVNFAFKVVLRRMNSR